MLRVWIAADRTEQVHAIAELLSEEEGIEVVDDVAHAEVVVAASEATASLAGQRNVVYLLEGAAEVKREGRGRAWLPAEVSAGELAAACFAAAADLTVLTAAQANRLLPRRASGPATETLTRRETQVLKMLASGLGNKEIGSALGISDHTAKFHVAQILAKLGAGSRTEAVTIAIRQGLIPV